MSSLRLQSHLMQTGRECWMNLPTRLLLTSRHFSSHSGESFSDESPKVVSLLQKPSHKTNITFQNSGRYSLKDEVSTLLALDESLNSCMHRNLDNFYHDVAVRLGEPQKVASPSCVWLPQSHQYCHSHHVLCSQHHVRTLSASVSCALLPVSASSCTSGIFLGLKGTVRFYRGQTRSQSFHNTRSQDTGEGYSSAHDEAIDGSGSEGEKSYKLLPVRNAGRQVRWDNLDVAQETSEDADVDAAERRMEVTRKPVDEMSLPELARTSFNIVPYVKRSETLQNLVRLGVNLDKIQREAGIAEYLIKCDFDRDILPHLKFLALVGVEAGMMGHIFTANPLLFKESVQDLELLAGYLLQKKFTLPEIAAMISCTPVLLLMNPVMLDEKLGFLQNVFTLTDREVREVVKVHPKLLPWKKDLLAEVRFHVKEFIGFSDPEIKQLFMKDAKIFVTKYNKLVNRFDYLHNHMMLSHQQILVWPNILRKRLFIFKNRHLFLVSLDRAQYDPCTENFVSLVALAGSSDMDFSHNVARCQLQDFYDFCRTL